MPGGQGKYAKRGFASIPIALRKAIASKGGKKAHAMGTAHTWTREEAKKAGSKGGIASRGGRGKLKPGDGEDES